MTRAISEASPYMVVDDYIGSSDKEQKALMESALSAD